MQHWILYLSSHNQTKVGLQNKYHTYGCYILANPPTEINIEHEKDEWKTRCTMLKSPPCSNETTNAHSTKVTLLMCTLMRIGIFDFSQPKYFHTGVLFKFSMASGVCAFSTQRTIDSFFRSFWSLNSDCLAYRQFYSHRW